MPAKRTVTAKKVEHAGSAGKADRRTETGIPLDVVSIAGDGPDRFINRELSWLGFNMRVLEEARNETIRFLSGSVFSPFRPTTSMNSTWCGSPVCADRCAQVLTASVRTA